MMLDNISKMKIFGNNAEVIANIMRNIDDEFKKKTGMKKLIIDAKNGDVSFYIGGSAKKRIKKIDIISTDIDRHEIIFSKFVNHESVIVDRRRNIHASMIPEIFSEITGFDVISKA